MIGKAPVRPATTGYVLLSQGMTRPGRVHGPYYGRRIQVGRVPARRPNPALSHPVVR